MKDTFSKADTMAVKGVAILFMLFAHLFNNQQLIGLSTPLAYVGEQPLVYLLIFAMNPVHFFIFLSGYGLSLSNKNGGVKDVCVFIRIIGLRSCYLCPWDVFGVTRKFIPVASSLSLRI